MNNSDEISLKSVVLIFAKRWRIFVILALLACIFALVRHKFFPQYTADGKIQIQNIKNSQLQSMLSKISGLSNEVDLFESKDENVTNRTISILDTEQFYNMIGEKIFQLKENQPNATLKSSIHYLFWALKIREKNDDSLFEISKFIKKNTTFRAGKDGQIFVSVTTSRRELSHLLINQLLENAKEHIPNKEIQELTLAETYFKGELDNVQARLDSIENQLIEKMQKTQILSVDMEKGEGTKYQNNLKKEISDLELKVTENLKRIEILKGKKKKSENDSSSLGKYSNTAILKQLLDENAELQLSINTLKGHLRSVAKQNKGLIPFQYEVDKMKATYNLEHKIFESLRENLSKIGLQKTYIKNKIEILEVDRLSSISSKPGLPTLLIIALFISQCLGIFGIYLYELLK